MYGEEDLVLREGVNSGVAAKCEYDGFFIEEGEDVRLGIAVSCDVPANNFHLILNIKENNWISLSKIEAATDQAYSISCLLKPAL
jgi:hypothetical protein